MAATRLIALHQRKGQSIAHSLNERTDYAKNPEKTEKGELITAYGCDPMTADEEFMLQKRQYYHITGKQPRHDIISYQIRQSFKPGEITAEEANRIGYELGLRFNAHRPGSHSQPYHFQFHKHGRNQKIQKLLAVRPGASESQRYDLPGKWPLRD